MKYITYYTKTEISDIYRISGHFFYFYREQYIFYICHSFLMITAINRSAATILGCPLASEHEF